MLLSIELTNLISLAPVRAFKFAIIFSSCSEVKGIAEVIWTSLISAISYTFCKNNTGQFIP